MHFLVPAYCIEIWSQKLISIFHVPRTVRIGKKKSVSAGEINQDREKIPIYLFFFL